MTINFTNLHLINKDLNHYNSSLLIVSKKQNTDIIEILLNKNYRNFGENRVQEAFEKFHSNLRNRFKNINLHLIGPLQSNKTSTAIEIFDTIQSIDRKKIIEKIDFELRNKTNVRVKNFYVQINIGSEPQKSGVLPNELVNTFEILKKTQLNVVGLMCIPPNDGNSEKHFKDMVNLRNRIDKNLKLSMGMSSDYKIALKNESNLIRIGSSIFE